MRQGVTAEVPLDSVVRAVVPRTSWLVRGANRGPNWFPIPFIYIVDIVGMAAIGAAFAVVVLGALALSAGRHIMSSPLLRWRLRLPQSSSWDAVLRAPARPAICSSPA